MAPAQRVRSRRRLVRQRRAGNSPPDKLGARTADQPLGIEEFDRYRPAADTAFKGLNRDAGDHLPRVASRQPAIGAAPEPEQYEKPPKFRTEIT